MICVKCANETPDNSKFCQNCGITFLNCDKCGNVISVDDIFCGKCGNDITSIVNSFQTNLEEIKTKKEIKNYSNNLIIECEGNKFKAIKMLKEKYNLTIDDATNYINEAYNNINNILDKKDSSNEGDKKDIIINSKEITNPNGIKKTIIVGSTSHKKATSAIGRGLVGSVLLGPIGLLAGTTAKTKDKTTFLVTYNNGKQETVVVKTNGWMFNQYCKFLDNE